VLAAIERPRASDSSCREMVAVLGRQRFNEDRRCSARDHRRAQTGSITALYHDAGIVDTRGPALRARHLTRGLEEEVDAHRLVASFPGSCTRQGS
jgi:hypothetical protein